MTRRLHETSTSRRPSHKIGQANSNHKIGSEIRASDSGWEAVNSRTDCTTARSLRAHDALQPHREVEFPCIRPQISTARASGAADQKSPKQIANKARRRSSTNELRSHMNPLALASAITSSPLRGSSFAISSVRSVPKLSRHASRNATSSFPRSPEEAHAIEPTRIAPHHTRHTLAPR